jgi:hypothetical protein
LDIISVGLPEDVAAELGAVSDLLPLVKPEGAVALLPLVKPEVADTDDVVDLLPLEKPELPPLLEPLENPLDLPPPPPLLLLPPLTSTKLAPTINKLITIANHNDFLNMLSSFHFCCLIN